MEQDSEYGSAPPDSMPVVAVLIPVYVDNAAGVAQLQAAMEQLQRQPLLPHFIIVVNDASPVQLHMATQPVPVS